MSLFEKFAREYFEEVLDLARARGLRGGRLPPSRLLRLAAR
jgi:hypothetical protein